MYNLDFLSEPPQISFLRKDSNQTSFGGFLFLIYLLIMIGISTIYVVDFIKNDKYNIEYSLIKNTEVDTTELNNDDDLNPLLNISFDLTKFQFFNSENLSERFVIVDFTNLQKIPRRTYIQKRPSEIILALFYDCEDKYCEIKEEDKTSFNYIFEMNYTGYTIDHQSDDKPLYTNNDKFFKEDFAFSFKNTLIRYANWQVIKYKEERGILGLFDDLFDIKSEYISGSFEFSESVNMEEPLQFNETIFDFGYNRFLGFFIFANEHKEHVEYKRIKVSLLDLLANIGALFSTFFACFIFVFKFYSKNYDNYKIVDSIINKKQINLKKNIEISSDNIELNSNIINRASDNRLSESENQNIDEINKDKPLIDDNKDDKNKKEEIDDKLTFIHFFLNNFQYKCCPKRKEQEYIDLCNDILSKYTSIELILYNQMMLENLWKEYKWNNVQFNSIENFELITQINNVT